VADNSRKVHLKVNGFFKDVLGWIGDETLIYVTGVGHVDEIGLVDVNSGAAKSYKLPSVGEVSGACIEAQSP
jgi:hypothetical protein